MSNISLTKNTTGRKAHNRLVHTRKTCFLLGLTMVLVAAAVLTSGNIIVSIAAVVATVVYLRFELTDCKCDRVRCLPSSSESKSNPVLLAVVGVLVLLLAGSVVASVLFDHAWYGAMIMGGGLLIAAALGPSMFFSPTMRIEEARDLPGEQLEELIKALTDQNEDELAAMASKFLEEREQEPKNIEKTD